MRRTQEEIIDYISESVRGHYEEFLAEERPSDEIFRNIVGNSLWPLHFFNENGTLSEVETRRALAVFNTEIGALGFQPVSWELFVTGNWEELYIKN